MDTDLVEAVSKVPSSVKQRGRIGKFIFEKDCGTVFTHSIIHRPKTDRRTAS